MGLRQSGEALSGVSVFRGKITMPKVMTTFATLNLALGV